MKLPPELEAKLKAPLPPEAITQHPTKSFLSSIKAIYVTERFNDVFGIGQWRISVDKVDTEITKDKSGEHQMIVIKTTFEVPEYDIYYESYGGNDNADLGDAYKGATTDAITKIGSYMAVGIDVFKGLSTGKKKPSRGVQDVEGEPFGDLPSFSLT